MKNLNTKHLKIIRMIAWCAVIVLLGVFIFGKQAAQSPEQIPQVNLAPTQRNFTMLNQFGKAVSEKDFAGKPNMMFFGFSNCPAICPGALADMGIWLEKLGKDSAKVNPIFVSLDPERDTPARLQDYLKSYNAQIVGLTGTPEQSAAIAKAYGIYYKKMPVMEGGEYMVDHSASIYLYSPQGALISTIDTMENRDTAFAKIKKLIEQK